MGSTGTDLRRLVHRNLLSFVLIQLSILGAMALIVSHDLRQATPWVLHPTITRILGWLVALYGLFWIAWWFFWTAIEGGGEEIRLYGVTWAPTTGQWVRTGPYRWVRYPLAFGYLEFLWGLGWLVQSSTAVLKVVPALVICALAYLRLVVDRRRLARLGEAYSGYLRKTPLFIPRIPPGSAVLHVFDRRKRD